MISEYTSLSEDAGDALNAVDCDGLSALQYCYRKNDLELARMILHHPKSREKLKLENADSAGKTLLHLAAQEGNVEFWRLLIKLPWCDLSVRDDDGNTPLMLATSKHQRQVLQSWLETQAGRTPDSKMLTVRNNHGHNLFMLVLIHLETELIRKFIDLLDISFCIDQCDQEGNNGLLITARAEKWDILKIILENNKIEDLAIDIHPTTKEGHSTLVLVLIAFVKLERKILNFQMKNDKVNLNRTKQESESLWEIVRTLLEKERDIHGTNPVSNKEAGMNCINKQLESSSQIKSPLTEDVLNEFTKLYKVKVKPKKKPEPVPEPAKEEPKKVLPVSSFQQKMNEIYKAGMEAERKKNVEEEKKEERKIVETKKPQMIDVVKVDKIENNSANNPKNLESEKILNLVSVVEKKVMETKTEIKTKTTKKEKKEDLKELEDAINEEIQWAYEQKRISKEEEDKNNIVKDVGLVEKNKTEDTDSIVSTEEPSLEEIRSRWKTKKPKTEVKKAEIDVMSIFEDIARKAEEKVNDGKVIAEENTKKKERDLEEAINEEIQWAYEQKRMMREEKMETTSDTPKTKSEDTKLGSKNIMDLINQTEKKVEEKKKEISEKKEDSVTEKKKDFVSMKVDNQKENSTKKEKLDSLHSQKSSNLASSVEKTAEKKISEIRIEKENDLEEAINEEIQWAYEQKRLMKEELTKPNGVTHDTHNHNNHTVVERNQVEMKKKSATDDKSKKSVEDRKKKALQEEEEILNQLAKKAEEKILKEKEEINKARQLESEKRRKEKELELAISEEILWANEQKKLSGSSSAETKQEALSLTPPAPVRRRRTGSVEDQETPPVPHRRRQVEPEPSPSTVETCNGQRSLGVGVDTRPGYKDASTQTDPVKTCDFAI